MIGEGIVFDVRDNFLLELWSRIRRHSRMMAFFALFGMAIGIGCSFFEKPAYRASTVIEVHELNQDFMDLKNISPLSLGSGDMSVDDVQTYIRKLQSRSLLAPVVEKLGMVRSPARGGLLHRLKSWLRKPPPVDPLETAIDQAQVGLQIQEIGRSRLIEIAFSSSDARLAAAFPNALASELLVKNLQWRGTLSQNVSDWITSQLGEMRAKLVNSERALEDYTRSSGMIFVGAPSGSASTDSPGSSLSGEKLREVQTELSQAEADRMNKEAQYQLARNSPPESLPFLAGDNVLRAQQDKLVDLYRQKAELGVNYTPNYTGIKSIKAQIDVLQSAVERERATILRQIQNDYLAAVGREKLLDDKYRTQAKTVTEEGVKSVQYQMLKREVESNRQLYDELLQRTKQASVAAALQANNINVVDPAKTPDGPYKPSLPVNGAAGLLGGVGLGAMCVTLLAKKSTITRPGELKSIAGVAELGAIQSWKAEGQRRVGRGLGNQSLASREQKLLARMALVNSEQQPSAIAQSYRSVLTSLRLNNGAAAESRILAFTSPSAVEGKTTVMSSLSVVLAKMQQRVLVVDGDMYKPELHKKLDGHNDRGLLDLLREADSSTVKLSEYVQDTAIPGLSLLASGRPDGATPLLFSPRLQDLFERFRQLYDFILIDTPPMLEIADARILGKVSDAVILVVRADQTTREAALASIERLREDGIAVLGTVLNDWNPAATDLGYYLNYGRKSRDEQRSYADQKV